MGTKSFMAMDVLPVELLAYQVSGYQMFRDVFWSPLQLAQPSTR